MSNAIAVRIPGLPDRPVQSVAEMMQVFAAIQDHCNLITPVTAVDFIPAMTQISLRQIRLDADPARGDVYKDNQFCKDDERAPSKVGLMKIWAGAGGSVVKSERLDDAKDPHLCHWQVTLSLKQLDGEVVTFPGSKLVDYRTNSDQIRGMSDKQVAQARRFTDRHAESKAWEAGIRAGLALKQKYTTEELLRPFVVPKLVPRLDESDPRTRDFLLSQRAGFTNPLYGPEAGPVINVTPGRSDEPRRIDGPEAPAEPEDLGEQFGDPPPPASAPKSDHPDAVCACPCGDDREISAEMAEMTIERLGAPRCPSCYPGKRFDLPHHRDLKTLGCPKNPHLTPAGAEENRQILLRQSGGGR